MNLPQAFRSRTAAVVTGAAALVLAATGGGAVAAGMVTSHDIQDGTHPVPSTSPTALPPPA